MVHRRKRLIAPLIVVAFATGVVALATHPQIVSEAWLTLDLEADDPQVRAAAAKKLAGAKTAFAISRLTRVVETDKVPAVLNAAMLALGEVGRRAGPRAMEAVAARAVPAPKSISGVGDSR